MRDNTNHGVAHAFAQQNSESGKTNNGNMFYEGRVIYSYGDHYPIAIFLKNGMVAFNSTSSSPTTEGKHKNAVNRALGYNTVNLSCVLMQLLNKYHDAQKNKTIAYFKKSYLSRKGKESIIQGAVDDAQYQCKQAVKRKKEYLRDSDYAAGIAALNEVVYFFDYIGVSCPKKILNFIDDIQNNRDSLQEKFEAEQVKDKKKRDKAERNRIKRDKEQAQEQLVKFRNHEPFNYFSIDNTYLLRVKRIDEGRAFDIDESLEIETSGKARFPISHAKKAWSIIKACKDSNQEFKRNGKSIHLGNFQIDSISENGDIIAGCHKVKYSEIESLAKLLNLI